MSSDFNLFLYLSSIEILADSEVFVAGIAPNDSGNLAIGVFFNKAGKKVPKGFFAIELKAAFCDVTGCA